MRVLIHHDNADAWRDALSRRLPNAEILGEEATPEQRREVDYLAAWQPPAELFAELEQLKGIVNLGAGVDALLDNPALPREIPIVKLRDAGMASPIADYVRYGVLHFQRDFDRYARQQASGEWREHAVTDKADWPVGVLGLGAIGAQVATSLAADGFPVHGWSRTPRTLEGVTCHHGDEGLTGLLGRVRSLVLLLPGTPATHQLINRETLARLPQGASLINPGRGSLIEESALLDALDSGHLRGALLDAFPVEPLPAESPLWSHPRILVTPHMAGPTPLKDAVDQVAEALRAFEAGTPQPTIDPEAGY
ncbi:glyoxylate/hydroxypyruvate reductase A [Halomonas sp. 18H]|uniref:2-hydroxyacid dehydrogenase n=1 Tax=Halomonas almeriensis TaxID=308163 RepID=UPI00222E70F1|nr:MULTISPECIES: glyoxylate/hydroxypyruvate reductase A [Halomonas]MCW4149631.1 glyoxylate/hydroxypyruvate reductase A [Halomonas sp. 18H]MDN3553424.1 glyoxylate/hydroxypyruvate reductase A [Halomonas almeriensis]